MSGKKEKQRRREQGISIAAKRGEAEFERLVVRHMNARADRRAAGRSRNRKGLAIGALAVIAALGALAVGAVL